MEEGNRKLSLASESSWCLGPIRTAVGLCAACVTLLPHLAVAEVAYSRLSQNGWLVELTADEPATSRSAEEPNDADETAPAISGQGQLAFERFGSLYVCLTSPDGCHELEGSAGGARPVWHPATGELVFARYEIAEGVENSDLWTANLDSGAIGPLVIQTGVQDDPDYSPGGRYLAYTTGQMVELPGMAMSVVRHVWVLDLGTGAAGPVTSGPWLNMQADWSPDSQRLVFASNRTGRFEIWRVDRNGADLSQVTSGEGIKTWPAWSPDGREIMFTKFLNSKYSLWITSVDGTEVRQFQPYGPDADIEMRDADWK